MRRMLALVLPQLVIGCVSRLFGDESRAIPGKGVRKGDRGFENTQTEVPGTNDPLSIPFRHPVSVSLTLGEKPISAHETGHRITRCIDIR